jgi:hypothetical protein
MIVWVVAEPAPAVAGPLHPFNRTITTMQATAPAAGAAAVVVCQKPSIIRMLRVLQQLPVAGPPYLSVCDAHCALLAVTRRKLVPNLQQQQQQQGGSSSSSSRGGAAAAAAVVGDTTLGV